MKNGDLILGDHDGVVAIPEEVADEAIALALEKVAGEDTVREELVAGVPVAEVFEKHGHSIVLAGNILAVATTQTEKAYRLLREKLMAGELEPGQRLVNRQLATEFGISVIPLREAISRLASEGLIQQIPGSGSFVRSTDEREMEELITFRACIESGGSR